MKSNYQLIVSITKCANVKYTRTIYSTQRDYILTEFQTVEKQLVKEPNSVQMIDTHAAKLSDYSYPITKSSHWTAVIGYPCDHSTIT